VSQERCCPEEAQNRVCGITAKTSGGKHHEF
jgi:hypothetical protein